MLFCVQSCSESWQDSKWWLDPHVEQRQLLENALVVLHQFSCAMLQLYHVCNYL